MKNLYGLTNIMVKVIDCKGDDVGELNKFLDEYNGNVGTCICKYIRRHTHYSTKDVFINKKLTYLKRYPTLCS